MIKTTGKFSRSLLIILALLGMLIMGYLISLHYSSHTGGTFCDLGEGLSCDIVNKSEYSEILGIPVSVLGFIYFLGALLIGLFRYSKQYLRLLFAGTVVLLGPSLYLTFIEIAVINNICVFCEGSKVLMLAIALVALSVVGCKNINKQLKTVSIIVAIIFAGIFHAVFSAAGPGASYVTFGQCLYENNVRMYGSQGCSFCAKQRAIFGDGIEEVKEIECDPRFPDAQYELCINKNIIHTPTWIIEDADGNDILRFDPGVIELEDLAEASGCPLTVDK